MQFIVILLWLVLSTNIFLMYKDYCGNLTTGQKIVISLIFIIGGPLFATVNCFTALLDCIFPEGWS